MCYGMGCIYEQSDGECTLPDIMRRNLPDDAACSNHDGDAVIYYNSHRSRRPSHKTEIRLTPATGSTGKARARDKSKSKPKDNTNNPPGLQLQVVPAPVHKPKPIKQPPVPIAPLDKALSSSC